MDTAAMYRLGKICLKRLILANDIIEQAERIRTNIPKVQEALQSAGSYFAVLVPDFPMPYDEMFVPL
jgi:hypothetical protein